MQESLGVLVEDNAALSIGSFGLGWANLHSLVYLADVRVGEWVHCGCCREAESVGMSC